VPCSSTKVAISLKRVQIEEKLLWRAYRNSPMLFPCLTPYGLPLTKMGFCTPPKTPIAIISGTCKATNFKFGQNIQRVHLNKSLLIFWRKGRVGVSRDCPIFFGYPLLSQEWEKLRISNLASTLRGSIRTKAQRSSRAGQCQRSTSWK